MPNGQTTETGRMGATGHMILVVDDEEEIRRGCARILTSQGYEVLLAGSGEQALEILGLHPEIELALVDLRMPGMSGLEVLERAKVSAPETVLVVITAYATIEAAVNATKQGAYDFVPKPFTPDEFLRIVSRSLERAVLIRERNRLESERRARMLELALEKSRLRTVIDCMSDGVLVFNADRLLVLFNPASLRFLRQDASVAAGLTLRDVVENAEFSAMLEAASLERKHLSHELKIRAGAAPSWFLVNIAPVRDHAGGDFLGTVTVVRDIAEQKKVEEVKAQFVNMVAHELRAPLAVVDGFLALMEQGYVQDAEKTNSILKRSRERTKALMDLVTDLLSLSRMEAGSVRREISSLWVGDLLREVMTLMEPAAAMNGIRVKCNIPEHLPAVNADREELKRLFRILADNAVKYNRAGGGITVSAQRDDGCVAVNISDTGIGISPEGQARVFTEFFREKREETERIAGTGLGLCIAKRIVDFYHGRIEVRSELGKGTTCAVRLPAADPCAR